MKNTDLIKKIARTHSIDSGAAADRVDRAVNQILRSLKKGKEARLPGLGTITPGKKWDFRQESYDK